MANQKRRSRVFVSATNPQEIKWEEFLARIARNSYRDYQNIIEVTRRARDWADATGIKLGLMALGEVVDTKPPYESVDLLLVPLEDVMKKRVFRELQMLFLMQSELERTGMFWQSGRPTAYGAPYFSWRLWLNECPINMLLCREGEERTLEDQRTLQLAGQGVGKNFAVFRA